MVGTEHREAAWLMAKSNEQKPCSHGNGTLTVLAAAAGAGVILSLAAVGFARESWDSARGVKENRNLIDAQQEVIVELGNASTQTRIDMAYIRGSLEQLLGKAGKVVNPSVHPPHGG